MTVYSPKPLCLRSLGLSGLLFGLAVGGCNGDTDGTDATMTPSDEDREACDDAQEEVSRICSSPNTVSVVADGERLFPADIPSIATAVDGGFYVAAGQAGIDPPDNVGFVLADNDTCEVSCIVACDLTTQSLCITAPVLDSEAEATGCQFCGQASEDECRAFIAGCGS